MADVLAIIPARVGSKGIAQKNFRPLAGTSPLDSPLSRAVRCATVVATHVVISTDSRELWHTRDGIQVLFAEWPLHSDDCPMIDIVQDVLARVDGPEDQIVLLAQPSQPLRQARHLMAAVALLEATHADSVVSVVQLPATHHPQWQARILGGRLEQQWTASATRRQDLPPVYIRDGTTYCFRRSTVTRFGNMYGQDVRPLLVPAEETCPLDTVADWAEAERRLCEAKQLA